MKKWTAITLLLAVFLLALTPFVSAEDLARLAGPDRYRTAIRVSETGWEYADTVVLVRGDHWADAIAGAPLARQLNAPIILTHSNFLFSEVAAELARLRTRRVVVLGGPEAVSMAVSEELKDLGLIVDRICGEDRYDTAARIAQWVAPAGSKRAFLVSGEDFADALSAASYAAADSLPILLTKKDTIPKATESALAALGAPTVLVVGGKSAISDQAIKGIDDTIRLGGKNRYETNISVTSYFRPYSSHYFFATGEDFPDALAVSVLAARRGMGLLLIGKEMQPATANYIQENVAGFTLLGGTAAISQQTALNIANNLTPRTGAIAGWTEPGALVRIGGRETIARRDGYYEVSGLADGSHQVSFQKTGFVTGRTPVQISQGRTSSISWPLAKLSKDGIVLGGCIIDQAGTPLADTDIKLEVWDSAWRLWDRATEIRTGLDGMFSWSNDGKWFEFNQPIRLSVSKKGYQPTKIEYVVASDTLLNTVPGLHLRRLATSSISGTVTCNGEAVPGAAIDLSTADGDHVARGASGPSGEYRFSELPLSPGDYILLAEKPGLGKYVYRMEIQEGDRVTCNPELKLGRRVCFYLAPEELLYEGSPAYFAQGDYSLRLLQNGLGIARKELAGVVGEVLRFDIPGLISPGLYTAVISGDYALTRSFEVSVGDADVSHYSRTPLAGAVSGKVVGPGGNALQGAVVRALSSGDETCIALTGPEGEFSFGGLLPGRRQFEIIFPRYKTLTTEILVLPNSTVYQDIMLDRISFRGTLSGYIRSAGSLLPIEGAEVTVNLQEPEVLPGMTDEVAWEDKAFTDKAGNFRPCQPT